MVLCVRVCACVDIKMLCDQQLDLSFSSLQEMFEKRRRRRESHNAVERRRRDNINERIHGMLL